LVAQGTDRPEKAAPLIADLLGIELGERYRPLNLTPQQKKQRTFEILLEQLEGLAALAASDL
jgi:hypothetical protein